MVKLLSYLSEADIVEFSGHNENEILQILFGICLKNQSNDVKDKVMNILAAKKNGKCITLSKNIAFTHIRLDDVEDIKVAVGIIKKGMKINKSAPLKVLFCMVIPADRCKAYLSLIAHLTRLLSDKRAEEVFLTGDKKKIISLIEEFEES